MSCESVCCLKPDVKTVGGIKQIADSSSKTGHVGSTDSCGHLVGIPSPLRSRACQFPWVGASLPGGLGHV